MAVVCYCERSRSGSGSSASLPPDFTDFRNPNLIEHTVEELVAQRVYGLALGYEDLNDHEELRNDPLLAVLVEKEDPGSQVLAGKSTLNRLELTKETASRKECYKKIVLDHGAVDRLLVEVFLQAFCILGPSDASTLNTRGGSRVPKLGSHGSVRGARSNARPYRENN
jgi:Transposase DDE domain group 1